MDRVEEGLQILLIADRQGFRFPGGLMDLDSHAVILLALFRKAVWLPAQHPRTCISQALHTSPPR
jgi:hypothetical protein